MTRRSKTREDQRRSVATRYTHEESTPVHESPAERAGGNIPVPCSGVLFSLDRRAYLMYRSDLVPRRLAMLGLIGGPLIIASGTGVLFNVFEPGSAAQVIATVPEFFWELGLGIYLIVKGFRPSPITSNDRSAVVVPGVVAQPA